MVSPEIAFSANSCTALLNEMPLCSEYLLIRINLPSAIINKMDVVNLLLPFVVALLAVEYQKWRNRKKR